MLLSFGKAEMPLKVSFFAMLGKILLAFLIVPRLGYLAFCNYLIEAGLLSAYFVVTVGVLLFRGLREIREQSKSKTETPACL